MLQGQLQRAAPAISGPNSLVLSFAPEYTASYQYCSGQDSLLQLETSLRQRTGSAWTVRFEQASGGKGRVNGTAPAPVAAPRLRPHEVMERFPLLQRALEVFHAIPMNVENGFGENQPAPAIEAAIPPDIEIDEA
jgi:hypothetical protein